VSFPDGAPHVSLVEIGRFNRNEAHILIGLLDSKDIPAVALDGNASIADGSYLLIPVRVMVDDEDEAAARRIIAALPES
jgi:hypothetical protein